MCYTSICTSVTVAVFNEATMNALTPVRHVSGVDEPQASRTVYVRAEHIFALACALATAFDLSDLRRLAVTSLSVALDNVVPVEGRTVAQIAFDLTSYATDSAPGGIKHLLEGALALNPRNPDLLELAAQWQDLVFRRAAPCPYPGMAPFSERQSDMYFGRTKEIQRGGSTAPPSPVPGNYRRLGQRRNPR